jgi:hypothetical protein
MTPRELKAWVKYSATRGAYCPAGCDGHKLLNDEPWLLVYSQHLIYFICEACALGWAGGHNVVEPDDVPAVLASRQWRRGGHGLRLAESQEPLTVPEYPAVLRNEAVALYRRLAANDCDGCGQTSHTVVFDIGRRNSRFVFCLCHLCILNGPQLDLSKLMVSRELADIASGAYSESLHSSSAGGEARSPVATPVASSFVQ